MTDFKNIFLVKFRSFFKDFVLRAQGIANIISCKQSRRKKQTTDNEMWPKVLGRKVIVR